MGWKIYILTIVLFLIVGISATENLKITNNSLVLENNKDASEKEGIEEDRAINYTNKLNSRYIIEQELDNYTVERHYLVINGLGSNDVWGNIEVDIIFEYPNIVNLTDDKFQEEINKKIIKNFFNVESIEGLEEVDFFSGYNRYEYGTYDIKYSDNNILSICANTSYSNGGPPAKNYFGMTFNMNEKVVLELSDFVEKEYVINCVESEKYEIIGRDIGMHGNKSNDKIVKNEIIQYINQKNFSCSESVDDKIFNYNINGYYIDGESIFIYIDLLESYGRNIYLKIPFNNI